MLAAEQLVVDASAVVELLLGTAIGVSARSRMRHRALHAPAHVDAEVLSALGRLHRAGDIEQATVELALGELTAAPITRHLLADLLVGAWSQRRQLRLVDALYVQLARSLAAPLLTADHRLARAIENAELAAPDGPE